MSFNSSLPSGILIIQFTSILLYHLPLIQKMALASLGSFPPVNQKKQTVGYANRVSLNTINSKVNSISSLNSNKFNSSQHFNVKSNKIVNSNSSQFSNGSPLQRNSIKKKKKKLTPKRILLVINGQKKQRNVNNEVGLAVGTSHKGGMSILLICVR